jgi:transposase-like protein
VEDILIVACDGLKGLPDAITTLWPRAEVHLVRASLRYASKKCWSAITKRLKLSYTAPNQEIADAEFTDFCAEWEDKCPDERDRKPEFPIPASYPRNKR